MASHRSTHSILGSRREQQHRAAGSSTPRTLVLAVAGCAAVLGIAGCAQQQPSPSPQNAATQNTAPRDVGNMAYPTPLPQGNIGTTSTTAASRAPNDVGSMAYPDAQPQGTVGRRAVRNRNRRPSDVGSMAYPTPQPEGDVSTTRTR